MLCCTAFDGTSSVGKGILVIVEQTSGSSCWLELSKVPIQSTVFKCPLAVRLKDVGLSNAERSIMGPLRYCWSRSISIEFVREVSVSPGNSTWSSSVPSFSEK